jgi:hypothetical protein
VSRTGLVCPHLKRRTNNYCSFSLLTWANDFIVTAPLNRRKWRRFSGYLNCNSGLGSSVSIVTGYGLDGGGEIFRTCPDRPWGPPSLLCNGYRVFPGGRKRPRRDADLSPTSSAEVYKQSRAIPLLSLRAFVAYEKGETYLPE